MDDTTLEKVAHLARLFRQPEERQQQVVGLTRILEHFESLARMELPPTLTAEASTLALRPDQAAASPARAAILANAPSHAAVEDGVCFSVPRVIE